MIKTRISIIVTSLLILLTAAACRQDTDNKQTADSSEMIQRENASIEKTYKDLGEFQGQIPFEVTTSNKKEYKDGIIPWISIENPEHDLLNLKDAKEVVINAKTLFIIIDYPIKTEYQVEANSATGFTRELLIKEISKAYAKIYQEEENTATIKTIPLEKRKIANRNETDGIYGIWGHDLADLSLANIEVYKNKEGQYVLALNLYS